MAPPSKNALTDKAKERINALHRKLGEAYERGATSEVTQTLIDDFSQLRKAYEEHIRGLRKDLGL